MDEHQRANAIAEIKNMDGIQALREIMQEEIEELERQLRDEELLTQLNKGKTIHQVIARRGYLEGKISGLKEFEETLEYQIKKSNLK